MSPLHPWPSPPPGRERPTSLLSNPHPDAPVTAWGWWLWWWKWWWLCNGDDDSPLPLASRYGLVHSWQVWKDLLARPGVGDHEYIGDAGVGEDDNDDWFSVNLVDKCDNCFSVHLGEGEFSSNQLRASPAYRAQEWQQGFHRSWLFCQIIFGSCWFHLLPGLQGQGAHGQSPW